MFDALSATDLQILAVLLTLLALAVVYGGYRLFVKRFNSIDQREEKEIEELRLDGQI